MNNMIGMGVLPLQFVRGVEGIVGLTARDLRGVGIAAGLAPQATRGEAGAAAR